MMIRKIYYGIIIFFAFAFGLITCVGGVFDDMCGNEIVQEIPSPNGKLKAVIFTRNCGATTGFSTQVSLLPITQKLLNSKGNILTTDWNGKAPTWEFGGIPVEVDWTGQNRLRIRYPREAETFTKAMHFDGVAIEYETYDGTQPTTSLSPHPGNDELAFLLR